MITLDKAPHGYLECHTALRDIPKNDCEETNEPINLFFTCQT